MEANRFFNTIVGSVFLFFFMFKKIIFPFYIPLIPTNYLISFIACVPQQTYQAHAEDDGQSRQ